MSDTGKPDPSVEPGGKALGQRIRDYAKTLASQLDRCYCGPAGHVCQSCCYAAPFLAAIIQRERGVKVEALESQLLASRQETEEARAESGRRLMQLRETESAVDGLELQVSNAKYDIEHIRKTLCERDEDYRAALQREKALRDALKRAAERIMLLAGVLPKEIDREATVRWAEEARAALAPSVPEAK